MALDGRVMLHARGVFLSLIVVLVSVCLFVCLLQVFVNVLTLEGCYLLHGPGWACYVTHARSVFVLDSCISFSLIVCLFVYFRCL